MATDIRRRVKLYALNADRQWDDRGTGHVSSVYVERLKGISLVVRAEADGSLLLESKIQPDTAYQKQQDTLIVWSEGDNFDLALSFQEKAGCDEIWEKICHVQGKDPSVEITQEIVEESEDERFEEMSDSAPPIELPPCEVGRLEEISDIIASVLASSPLRKERLALVLESENYIKKLLAVFNKCEEAQNMEALHRLYDIFRDIFLLNKNALFDIMFTEEAIFDVVGCLEYDPISTQRKKHRQYLKSLAKFREAIPITNRDLLAKIHQTFRVQYIQDVVLPTPSVFEDNMLNTLSSYIFFNKVEIVTLIQEDEKFLIDLFTLLSHPSTNDAKRRDIVLFLKEFCNYAQNLQPPGKDIFYKTLNSLGVLLALETTLPMADKKTKQASIDILTAIVEYSPSIVRDHCLDQARSNATEDNMFINVVINEMLNDTEPELGGAVQLMGVIKILIDPENMVTSLNKSEKTDFLNLFYKHSMSMIISPLLSNTVGDKPPNEDYHTVQILGLVLELLSFCVEHHTYHVRNCILQKDLLRRILVLMKSSHTFLVLGALRFLRKIIALKDDFYYRHIVKGNLLAPVVDAFIKNNGRYNLLESAILELFEFIKIEDIKTLCTYVIENFGKIFDDVDYVQTFKNLKMKYEQHQDRLRDRDKSLDSIPPQILRNTRYRRDQRQLEEEEEMWFNEEEDFTEVVPQHKNDLDTTLDFLGKLIDKKTSETAVLAAVAAAAVNGPNKVNNNPIVAAVTGGGGLSGNGNTTSLLHQNVLPQSQQLNSSLPNSTNNSNKTDAQKTLEDGFVVGGSVSVEDNLVAKSNLVITNATTTNTSFLNSSTTTAITNKQPNSLPTSSSCDNLNDSGEGKTSTSSSSSSPVDENNENVQNISNSPIDISHVTSSVTSVTTSLTLSSSTAYNKNIDSTVNSNSIEWEGRIDAVADGKDSCEKNDKTSNASILSTAVSITNDTSVTNASVPEICNTMKKGLVDYEGDSDDEDDEDLQEAPQCKKQRTA